MRIERETVLLCEAEIDEFIDRIFRDRVTDMFWFRKINFPVFNVADSCITVATIFLILTWFTIGEQAKKAQPAIAETPTPGTE